MKWVKVKSDDMCCSIDWCLEKAQDVDLNHLITQQIIGIALKHYKPPLAISEGTYTHALQAKTSSKEIIKQFSPFFSDNYPCINTIPPFFFTINAQGQFADPNQQAQLIQYCGLIKTYAHLDDETYLDLLKTIRIGHSKKHYETEIANHLNGDPINFTTVKTLALEAQQLGYFDVIYETAIKLINMGNQNSLMCRLELLQAISKNNTHYEEANEQICNLLTELWSKGLLEMQENDYHTSLFLHVKETGNQVLLDQFFHRACGGTGLQPDITNVQGDVNFLVDIAMKCKKLATECQELKNRNARLETGAAAIDGTNRLFSSNPTNTVADNENISSLDYSG